MDPARSDYKLTMNEDYSGLSKNDADFVEVVHTNGGTNHSTIAIFDPIGHVDFYANGGQHQPGCQNGNHFKFEFLKSTRSKFVTPK